MIELAVPSASIDAIAIPHVMSISNGDYVRAIAAPVVAAELRAHASTIEASAGVADSDGAFPADAFAAACRAIAGDLRQRADELDAT